MFVRSAGAVVPHTGEEAESQQPSYLHLSRFQLFELVRRKKPFNPAELEALDLAWFHVFGLLLTLAEADVAPTGPSLQSTAANDNILGVNEVLRITKLSLTLLKRRVLDGSFPKPRRFSCCEIGWFAREVQQWVEQFHTRARRSRSADQPAS